MFRGVNHLSLPLVRFQYHKEIIMCSKSHISFSIIKCRHILYTHTYIYIYIYIYLCGCGCVCVCVGVCVYV